jgi:hypothetical protein
VAQILDAQVSYVFMTGALVAAGSANGGTDYDPSLHAAMLDPMYVPDAGSPLLEMYPTDYYAVTPWDGCLVSIWDFPGKFGGFPWRWWEYDTESEIFPDYQTLGTETSTQYNPGFDLALIYSPFIPQTDVWPTVPDLLTLSEFVEYDRSNCLDLARRQIAKKGYCAAGYGVSMFQIYDRLQGTNVQKTQEAIGYIHEALKRGIPIIVGVDYSGTNDATNPNPDKTTDHFIVIVGSGVDEGGRPYFKFFDNATNFVSKGANNNNRLYYDTVSSELKGQTHVTYSNGTKLPEYRVTQVRRSNKCN